MSWSEYFIILGVCVVMIFICRTIPLLFLKGRQLHPVVIKSLQLIPPATFAALVASDVLSPTMFNAGLWPAGAIVIASICVIAIAVFTKSLLWSAIGGVISYALLLYWEVPYFYIASIIN